MNILYVVDTFSVVEPMGVLQLSAVTKVRGHQSFIASIDDGDVERKIEEDHIDVVAYSFMSTEARSFYQLTLKLRIRFPKLVIIAGGPHPTYYPQIVDQWSIDALVVGEGDLVLSDLLENLLSGKDISHLPNIHTKKFKNAQGDLVADLDTLPFADRELVKDVAPFKYVHMKSFFGTRGCPFKCTYCFNSAWNKMHKNKGEVLRRRSAENIVSEIELVKKNYPMDFVRFGDDTFVMQHDQWVDEFSEKYSKRIGLPFYFLIHPNLVDDGLVKVLKKAGCHSVMMGIESGSERLRKSILDRHVSNETIFKAFKIFRDYDIKVFSNTILGLPSSDLKDDLQSVDFTLTCQPTYSGFTVFTPFPGTELHKYSKENGYLKATDAFSETFPASMQQGSVLNHITEKQKDIHRNILLLAPIANTFPFLKNWIVKHLIYWKPNFAFNFFGFLVRNYLNMQIWPFKKSLFNFFMIVKKVLRIDKKNYSSNTEKISPPLKNIKRKDANTQKNSAQPLELISQ